MTEAAIEERLVSLTRAIEHMSRLMGARLTTADVCDRLGIHRNTLRVYVKERKFPAPGRDGKYLLAEVIEWESGVK